jgi:hypothetical protein
LAPFDWSHVCFSSSPILDDELNNQVIQYVFDLAMEIPRRWWGFDLDYQRVDHHWIYIYMTNISQDLGSLIYLSNGNFANLTHQKKDIKTSKNNNQQTNVPDVDTLIPRFWDAHAFSC